MAFEHAAPAVAKPCYMAFSFLTSPAVRQLCNLDSHAHSLTHKVSSHFGASVHLPQRHQLLMPVTLYSPPAPLLVISIAVECPAAAA